MLLFELPQFVQAFFRCRLKCTVRRSERHNNSKRRGVSYLCRRNDANAQQFIFFSAMQKLLQMWSNKYTSRYYYYFVDYFIFFKKKNKNVSMNMIDSWTNAPVSGVARPLWSLRQRHGFALTRKPSSQSFLSTQCRNNMNEAHLNEHVAELLAENSERSRRLKIARCNAVVVARARINSENEFAQ